MEMLKKWLSQIRGEKATKRKGVHRLGDTMWIPISFPLSLPFASSLPIHPTLPLPAPLKSLGRRCHNGGAHTARDKAEQGSEREGGGEKKRRRERKCQRPAPTTILIWKPLKPLLRLEHLYLPPGLLSSARGAIRALIHSSISIAEFARHTSDCGDGAGKGEEGQREEG